MAWRLATGLIVLFWAVMTVLLIRHTYYRPEAEFAQVPVGTLLDKYAKNPNPSNTLQLMQGTQKCGNATLVLVDWKDPKTGAHKGYTFQAGGIIAEEPYTSSEPRMTWSFSGDLTDDERWERITFGARSSVTETFASIGWKLGQETPTIEVRKGEQLVMDTQGALEEAKKSPLIAGMGSFTSMIPGMGGKAALSLERLVRLTAKEAALPLAGRPRKALTLNASLMGLYQTKAWFTDAGELVKVDLPQGFRLVNPMVLGMDAGK